MLTAWSTDCSASKVINPKPSQRPKVNQGSRVLGQNKVKNRGRGVDQGDTVGVWIMLQSAIRAKVAKQELQSHLAKELILFSVCALKVQTNRFNYSPLLSFDNVFRFKTYSVLPDKSVLYIKIFFFFK